MSRSQIALHAKYIQQTSISAPLIRSYVALRQIHNMLKRVPSFAGLSPASEASSRAKRSNKHSDTEHELILCHELRRAGLRFRKHVLTLPGKPDIVFRAATVIVFCDGDFWHGRNWKTLRRKLRRGTNSDYWSAKIASNINRDRRNTALLERVGWYVIRLWETDIRRDPRTAAGLIKKVVENRSRKLIKKAATKRRAKSK